MQRQSLGSPVPKFHDVTDDDKTAKPRRSLTPSSLPSPPLPLPPSSAKPEKLIHLIPFLIFFCFLVLYLASHTPPQSDLAQFNGFKLSSKLIDTSTSEVKRLSELRRGNVLAIRSFRNLQEAADKRASLRLRPHRKVAGF
ncbi:hypothetical protein K2173_009403 [Erythroxylum novogranatense]|uniref:Uncharacterized protein n=1 Tax=Erythroxylum novogranatense TaxID=1862640 RepID=A0AAV8U3U9_9ROSI|nr:hypothetical protein K2173_009403 [Erythroxylum novogranatense]